MTESSEPKKSSGLVAGVEGAFGFVVALLALWGLVAIMVVFCSWLGLFSPGSPFMRSTDPAKAEAMGEMRRAQIMRNR